MSKMNTEEVISAVNEAMVEEFELDPSILSHEANFIDDLELDSLDSVDLIATMDRTFGIHCPEQEARQLKTMADMYSFIEKLVNT